MSASTSHKPPTAISSIRPRTRRLISGLDEGDEIDFDPTTALEHRIASPVPSLLDHRSISPIPSGHLSRPATSYNRNLTSNPNNAAIAASNSGTSLERLWGTSWTAIQGIASDLLGSSTHEGPPLAKGKIAKVRRPQDSVSNRTYLDNTPRLTWGPSTPNEVPTINDVGTGTKDEAEAAFRARKRIDLLEAQESSFLDSSGRFKRRTSNETLAVDDHQGRDALVYLHHVQKNDTLAGITLKYDCSAAVVRRTNRMWPNDPVQGRTTILLPVDACGVKGRTVSGPDEVDFLGDENAPMPAGLAESAPSTLVPNAEGMRNRSNSSVTNTTTLSSTARSTAASDIAWHHDSWVLLPGTTKPTEIVRLLRHHLGYFPPARRKSLTLSDMESPRSSFERPRSMITEAMTRPSQSPVRKATSLNDGSNRRMSNARGYFSTYLTGPGGVGSMDRTVRAPGPAPDSLNMYFAKHLPDVAPPRNQHSLYQPELPLYTDDITPTLSGTSTPNKNKNFEQMGSAIESWMRRVASKAKEATTPAERQRAARASVGAPGKGAGGIGDLIEMTDEFEIGNDDELDEHEPERGIEAVLAPSASSSFFGSTSTRQRSTKSGKAD